MIFQKDPDTQIDVPFDWTDAISVPNGISLSSVVHVMPTGLTKLSEQTDHVNSLSSVRISGGANPQLYVIEAEATLSTGEIVVKRAPVRVFAG